MYNLTYRLPTKKNRKIGHKKLENARLSKLYNDVYKKSEQKHFTSFLAKGKPSPEHLKIIELFSWKGKKVIDVGCGTGLFAYLAAKKGADVTGIDFSEQAIKLAQRNYHHRKLHFKKMNINESVINKTSEYFKKKGIVLPKISELTEPTTISEDIQNKLKNIDRNDIDPLNLFRVHWHNNRDHTAFSKSPEYIVLPSEFTNVQAKIIVNLGRLFPLITAHKVLAAYACLLPRLLNGEFDYSKHKAVWPSTGNYCRGGVAISRILGLKSVAILPEGMSRERFEWLERWVEDPKDIIKTKGTAVSYTHLDAADE